MPKRRSLLGIPSMEGLGVTLQRRQERKTMSKWKTEQEIDAEEAKLNALKRKVPRENGFGDPMREAVEAQCSVLRERMTHDDVYDAWGDETAEEFNQYLLDEALAARDWMTGERATSETSPSEGWAGFTEA
jgi:hypothetical protein